MRGGLSGMGRPRRGRGYVLVPPKAILEVPPGMETPLPIVEGVVLKGTQVRGAAFSPDGVYRYALWRTLSAISAHNVGTGETAPPVAKGWGDFIVIGLNPSTADENDDDPTIRRCIGFARREGCARLVMLNLFAVRTPDPDVMKAVSEPIGPLNDAVLEHYTTSSRHLVVVAAWGVHGAHRDRGREVARRQCALMCFGKTKDGHPKHPLYLKATTPLVSIAR